MKRLSRLPVFSVSFASAIALASACRSPVTENKAPPDAGPFDAGEQDAGPLAFCPEGSTPDLFNEAHSPYFGGEESVDITVDGVSYFRCPYCAEFAVAVRALWEKKPEYQRRVRLYFHHYPLTWHDPDAWEVHQAAVAAHNQGMEHFWALHDRMFQWTYDGTAFDLDDIRAFLADRGLDMDLFEKDLVAKETIAFLQWDKSQGDDAGVEGTPSVYVCGQPVSRNYLEAILDNLLEN